MTAIIPVITTKGPYRQRHWCVCARNSFVGARLPAKADFQAIHLCRTFLRLRGQARSYKGHAW
jgi:hypothetical protein